jgi:NADH dehydrogenase
LAQDFRRISPERARTILVEAGPRILSSFPEHLSDYARRELEELGVELRFSKPVVHIDGQGVRIGEEDIGAGTVVWAAGVRAGPAARWLDVVPDRSGRVPVEPDLSVRGIPNVYAIGDLALLHDEKGVPLPGLAQVAKQQGDHLGRNLADLAKHGTRPKPFRFRDRGNVAIIGRNAAVFDLGRVRLRGRIAWLAWAIVHVYLLVGFEHRVLVSVQWLWRYLTYERGARLIADNPGTKLAEARKHETRIGAG